MRKEKCELVQIARQGEELIKIHCLNKLLNLELNKRVIFISRLEQMISSLLSYIYVFNLSNISLSLTFRGFLV